MIKPILVLLVAATAGMMLTSFNTPKPSEVTITISDGTLSINGKAITPSWKRKHCEKILGKANRVDKDNNNVDTYDSLSILLYETGASPGALTEIQAHFRVLEPDDLTPKGSGFKGKIVIDNVEITPALKPAALEDKLEKWRNTGCHIDHCYRFANKGIYIFFQFNADENELTDVSIGPDRRK